MKVAEDARFLELIANHPQVFPFVSFRGLTEIRFGPAWDTCMGLEFDTGGFVFQRLDNDWWEVHTLFLPKSREPDAAAEKAMRYMFEVVAAEALITQIPHDLPHVRRFAERHGFSYVCPLPVIERESGEVAVDLYHLTKQQFEENSPCPQPQS